MDEIAGTADTAAISKRSAAQLGYVDDAFAAWFDRSSVRCAPIINRGTFVRVAAIDAICEQFAPPPASSSSAASGEQPQRQILSLGAGLDTRAWRMRRTGSSLRRYVEVDLPQVVALKTKMLRAAQRARANGARTTGEHAPAEDAPDGLLAAPEDALVSVDLADLDSLRAALVEARFDPSLPTLVLIECVLVYMAPQLGSSLLRFLSDYLPDAACLAYEMIRPDDAFGRQMRANLESRGLRIPGIDGCSDTSAHEARFAACGWQGADAVDMLHWYDHFLPRAERTRVERLEWLDEMEEWQLLLSHYCFVLARTRAGGTAADAGRWASALTWAPPPRPARPAPDGG